MTWQGHRGDQKNLKHKLPKSNKRLSKAAARTLIDKKIVEIKY